MGVFAAGFAVWTYLQTQVPSYGSSTDIDDQQNADSLIQFLNGNDSKKVHVDVVCRGSPGSACDATGTGVQSLAEGSPVLSVNSNGQTYWLHISTGNSGSQADNGGYGAGALVIKGNFTVSVRGTSGVTPPGIQNINLTGA